MKQNNSANGRSSQKKSGSMQPSRPKRQAVPPLDAFDNLPQRRPTNPYDKELEEREISSQHNSSANRQTVQNSKSKVQNGKQNTSQSNKKRPRQQANQNVKQNSGEQIRKEKTAKSNSSQKPIQAKVNAQNTKKKQKVEKQKKKPISSAKRRKNRRITAFVLTFLFIVVGIVVSVRIIFKIEKFSVVLPEGEEMIYTEQEVEQAFGRVLGEGLFTFDNKTEEEKIEMALPYIDTVKIRKKLPNTVEFNITPAHETYYVELSDGSGNVAVLSSKLKVLKISETVPENTIYIHGAGNVTAVPGTQIVFEEAIKAAALQTVLTCAGQQGVSRVNWIDVNNIGGISIRIQNRLTIVLGSATDLDQKLQYAMLLINDASQSELTETDAGTLDVSAYPNGNASFRPGDGSRW